MMDSDRCKTRVTIPGIWSQDHQCSRKAKKDGFCKQHHPDTVAARDKKSQEKADADWGEVRYKIHGKSFYKILVEIRDGHNDPRQLATEILAKFEK